MSIETEVLEAVVEVVLPVIATGAGEQTGAQFAKTAASAAAALGGAAMDRVIGGLRQKFNLDQESTRDEVRRALMEMSKEASLAQDLVVLAGATISSANRDYYQVAGDAYKVSASGHNGNAIGSITTSGPVHIGSKRNVSPASQHHQADGD